MRTLIKDIMNNLRIEISRYITHIKVEGHELVIKRAID